MRETQVGSLGREVPLEKEMATHSSTLAWRIPRTEEPGGLQSTGSQSRTRLSNFTYSPPNSPPIQVPTYYWAEFPVLYGRTLLVIYFKCIFIFGHTMWHMGSKIPYNWMHVPCREAQSTARLPGKSLLQFKKKEIEGFSGGLVVKNPPATVADTGSSPPPGRSHMPRDN